MLETIEKQIEELEKAIIELTRRFETQMVYVESHRHNPVESIRARYYHHREY